MSKHQVEVDDNVQAIIQQLREDNELYRQNFEVLRKKYIERCTLYEEQHLRWKAQLEEKSKDLDALRDKFELDTRELNQMRIRVEEDLEIRKRLEHDLQQSNQFRNMYNDLRRTHEQLKVQSHQQIEMMQNRLKEVRTEYEQKIVEIQQEQDFLKKEQIESAPSSPQKDMIIQKENDELKLRIKELLSELSDVRNEKNMVFAEKERASISHSQQFSQLLAKVRTLESDIQRVLRKNERLQKENDQIACASEKLHDQVLKLEKERLVINNRLEEQTKEFESERIILKANFELREREEERQRSTLMNQVNDLNRRIETLQNSKQDLLAQLSQLQSDSNEKFREVLVHEGNKFKELELEKQQLQTQVHELQSKLHLNKQNTKSEVQRSLKEVETLRGEMQIILDEKDSLSKRLEAESSKTMQLRTDIESLRLQIDKVTAEMTEMQRECEKQESCKKEAESCIERQKLIIEFKDKQISELSELLEKEKATTQAVIESGSQKLLQERKKLQDSVMLLKEELERIQEKYAKLKTIHHDTIERYKTKINSLNKKIVAMKSKAEEVELESKSAQELLWKEKQHFTRRISELEREKERLSFLLQSTPTAVGVDVGNSSVDLQSDLMQSAVSSTGFEKLYSSSLRNFKELQAMSQRVDMWK